MSTRTWHKGPPPHVGWWNASQSKDHEFWCWWDGENWFGPAAAADSVELASEWASIQYPDDAIVCWSDYWPENARVPRVNPNEVEA